VLQVNDLAFGFGEKPLYSGVNFRVSKGQKIGLVGPNGSGKSTLLSIIRGVEHGFTGKVKLEGSVSLVPQEIKHDPIMDKSRTVREYVDPNDNLLDFEINTMFKGLELSINLNHDPKTLSGGQKTKLALARALFENPDILMLDEPTNFMDIGGKKWVMKFLANYQGAVIVISHDLELMDTAIDKILAVTPYNGRIEEYKGNYTEYIKLKADKEMNLKKELEIKERHLKRTEERYNNSRAVATKSILRRKVEREREALPEVPQELRKISIKLPEPKRIGEVPIKTVEIKKNYGDLEVLKGVDFTILRGERIAIIGSNGTGKSTFIKILMDMIKADSGEVRKNSELSVGYYSQEFETFDFNKSVIDTFCEFTKMHEGMARSFLGKFMFAGDKQLQRVGSLSGGEKTRLSIACLTGKDNNLLILDEPTTYLDVMSQRIILEALKEYKGTMIIVSHEPEFMKELKPTKAYFFPEHSMKYWDDELLDKVEEV
jgi:ATPase subunit of ABC transporter with duplicated ATPase domains